MSSFINIILSQSPESVKRLFKSWGEIFRPAPCCRSSHNTKVASLGDVFRNERCCYHTFRNAIEVHLVVSTIAERLTVRLPVTQGEKHLVCGAIEILDIVRVVCRDDLRDGTLHALEAFVAFLVVFDKFALFEDLRQYLFFELCPRHRSVDEELRFAFHLFDLLEIILHNFVGLADTLRGTLRVLYLYGELGGFLAQVPYHTVEAHEPLAQYLILHARRAVERIAEEDEAVEHVVRDFEVVATKYEEALRAVFHILRFEGSTAHFIAGIAAVHYRACDIERFGVADGVILVTHNAEDGLRVCVLGNGKEVLHFRAVGEVDGRLNARVVQPRRGESFVEGVAIGQVLPDAVEHGKAFKHLCAPFGGGVKVLSLFGVFDGGDGFAHGFYLLVVGVVGFDVAVAVNGQGDVFCHNVISFGGLPRLFLNCAPA